MQSFFAELEDREKEFGISDIQIGLTTLEEVFLNIARKAELEDAAAEGSSVALTLESGVTIQVKFVNLLLTNVFLKTNCFLLKHHTTQASPYHVPPVVHSSLVRKMNSHESELNPTGTQGCQIYWHPRHRVYRKSKGRHGGGVLGTG